MATALWGIGLTGDFSTAENGWQATMNANLRKLTTLTQAVAKDKDQATPPGSPTTGDTYIVAASPTGAWSGHATAVTVWDGTAWVFYAPSKGWRIYVDDEDADYRFDGASWVIL